MAKTGSFQWFGRAQKTNLVDLKKGRQNVQNFFENPPERKPRSASDSKTFTFACPIFSNYFVQKSILCCFTWFKKLIVVWNFYITPTVNNFWYQSKTPGSDFKILSHMSCKKIRNFEQNLEDNRIRTQTHLHRTSWEMLRTALCLTSAEDSPHTVGIWLFSLSETAPGNHT